MSAAETTALRQRLRAAGFNILPLVGKRPVLQAWQDRTEASAGDVELWPKLFPAASNTGALTARMPSLDIDVLNPDAVRAVVDLVLERFEERGPILARTGRWPKTAIVFRTLEPFQKIVANLVAPGGVGEKIEFLAAGQQVVVDGTHPDTKTAYSWHGGDLAGTGWENLPYIHQAEAKHLVDNIVEMLCRDHGYSRPAKANGHDHDHAGHQGSDWDELVANMLSGHELHDSTVSLAAKLIAAGMNGAAAANFLRGLYFASTAPRDARWSERFDDIDRAVESAEAKFARKPDAPTGGLGIWNAGEVSGMPPPRGWLLGNSFCRCRVSALIAAGGTGKSALRLAQAIALAGGKEITGEHVFARTRTLIVSLEDDRHELERRVLAACLHHGITKADLDGWLYLSTPGSSAGKLMTANPRTGALSVGELAAHIEAAIVQYGIRLVIIDPLVKAHSVSENDNGQMDALAQLLADMACRHDIAIDLPHHVSKGVADPGNADRGRGASAMNNAARLAYTLTSMSSQEAERFGVPADDRRDYVRLDRAKLNIARSSGAAAWFKLVSVQIGNGTEDYPAGDSVQAVEPWTPPETWAGLDNALLNQILSAIEAGPGGGDFYTHANGKTDRNAWEVVHRFAPAKTEAQCREIIGAWLKSGLVVKFEYRSPATRQMVKGLKIDNSKRPT